MPGILKVSVVVCVHNALEDVKNCISSILKTDYPKSSYNLIIVDDGSEAETANYLRDFKEKNPEISLMRREKAGGYTIAANTGLGASDGDIVALLNSDTIVPKRWLKKMTQIFHDFPDVGIIGPLSNAASWQSVPERSNPKGGWAINELPQGMSIDDMDAIVEKAMEEDMRFPRVPLLNGFCYLIRRSVTEKIGYLDEVGFPRGFGEEDDFSLRAADAGFGLMIATNTYVFHAKSKSYGSQKRNELSKKGQEVLKLKHTEQRLKRSTETLKINPYLEKMRLNITSYIARETTKT